MSNKKKTSSGASAPSAGNSRREQLRQRQEAEAARARRMRIIGVAAAVLALALIAVVGTVVYNSHRTKVNAASAMGTPPHHNADNSGIVVNPGKAKADAPTLSIYLDYQCPICKQVETTYGPAFEALADKGDITLEYRTMNFMDTNLANTASTRAAVAAACSDVAGVYAKYHDEVYKNQAASEVKGSEGYSDTLLQQTIPATVGLTGQKLTDFQTCTKTSATKDFIEGTNEAAGKAGITGTPSFKVNGKDFKLDGVAATEQAVLAAIKAAA